MQIAPASRNGAVADTAQQSIRLPRTDASHCAEEDQEGSLIAENSAENALSIPQMDRNDLSQELNGHQILSYFHSLIQSLTFFSIQEWIRIC